jgi:hypothetical protein
MLAFQQQIPNLIETMAFWAFAQRVARLTIAIRVLKVNTVFHLNIAANTGRTPEFTGNFIYLESNYNHLQRQEPDGMHSKGGFKQYVW